MNNEIIAITISLISLGIAVINTLYTRNRIKNMSEFHKQNFDYSKSKDADEFVLNFKDDLNELRISMLELYTTKSEIKIEEKGLMLYVLESKYNKSLIIKYFNKDIYKKFMDFKILTDESLDKVIYKKNFTSISSSIRNIKYFLDSVNNYINRNQNIL